jgi:[ribosomal protein S5]-alanine N-acetyltransferase
MEIQCAQCLLRPWHTGDEESLVHHANNRNVWINLADRFPHPYTRANAIEWIGIASMHTPPHDFAIIVDGVAVGGVGIILKDGIRRHTAEIGYWLGEEYWGRGIATEALKAMTEYAFKQFDLVRIQASVFDWNPASMRVLEKAGYQREAVLTQNVKKDNRIIDEYIYCLLNTHSK